MGKIVVSVGWLTRQRMLNVHVSMPAHIVPMVEVAPGSGTDTALTGSVGRAVFSRP